MKPSDFLNQLPSVNELLDHPQVRSVTDRLNRSVVATQVRSYLDQLTEEAKRRAAGAEQAVSGVLPESMRELVDRVSRLLTSGERWRLGAVINATGRLRGEPWASAPLAEAAVERIALTASDFTTSSTVADESSLDANNATTALCQATGSPAAVVLNSRLNALWLSLASCSPSTGGEVVVARHDLRTLDGGCRLLKVIEGAGLVPREVGATDTVTLDDYQDVMGDATVAILRVAADDPPAESPNPITTQQLATQQLATLAHQHNALLIEDLASAPLLPLDGQQPHLAAAADGLTAKPVSTILHEGADLVLCRGDGLFGGPACGVVLGTVNATEQIRQTPLFAGSVVEAHVGAALAATVDLLTDQERFWFNVPVWSLLTSPLENLQSRADRIAAQLSSSGAFRAVDILAQSCLEASPTGLPIRLPTVTIALTTATESSQALAASLRNGEPAVWCRAENGRLLIDLRSVFPRQDADLVEILLRKTPV